MPTTKTIKKYDDPRSACAATQSVATRSFYLVWLDLKIDPPAETS
ncbi:MAG TPA: hypothetical protein VGK00_16840 [Anaerolineales bacterium]|jgi:hypothetical protein